MDTLSNKSWNYTYCPENTHPAGDILNSKFSESVTSVLLLAQLFSDEDCDTPLDAIEYNGVLFVKDRFIDYVLSAVKTKDRLNYYERTSGSGTEEDPYKYTQISNKEGYFELASNNGSDCYVKTSNVLSYKTLYRYNQATKEYVAMTTEDSEGKLDLSELDTDLKGVTPDKNSAIRYNKGLMYYNIPIQHLANPTLEGGTYNKAACVEGQYGVVRNHIYDLTINSIANLGYGIFDPEIGEGHENGDDPIIPDNPTKDPEKYKVGVTINILSWKIVSQGVSL